MTQFILVTDYLSVESRSTRRSTSRFSPRIFVFEYFGTADFFYFSHKMEKATGNTGKKWPILRGSWFIYQVLICFLTEFANKWWIFRRSSCVWIRKSISTFQRGRRLAVAALVALRGRTCARELAELQPKKKKIKL